MVDQIGVGGVSYLQLGATSFISSGFSTNQHPWSWSTLKAKQSSPCSFKHKAEHVNLSIGLEAKVFKDVIVSGLINFFAKFFWTKLFDALIKQNCSKINHILVLLETYWGAIRTYFVYYDKLPWQETWRRLNLVIKKLMWEINANSAPLIFYYWKMFKHKS